jgi:hypothetical protein
MSEPNLYFIYNHSNNDTVYSGTGLPDSNWRILNPSSDKIVFTGGGILGALTIPTCASGTRDATIRPSVTSYVIPQTYVETSALMYNVPLVGYNNNRYCMGVYVDGTMNSDLYLEAWDDVTFSTTNLAVLQGSANSSNKSYINAIRTTHAAPPWGPGWNGTSTGAAYLRGTTDRVALDNSSFITNKAVYYNIYIRLETDSSTFNNQPVLSFRYLYT